MSAQTENLSNNNLWILSLLPPKIPGQVVKKLGNPLIIQPLIEALPLDDGSVARQFFAPGGMLTNATMSYSSGKTLENVVLIIQKMPLGILQQFALKLLTNM